MEKYDFNYKKKNKINTRGAQISVMKKKEDSMASYLVRTFLPQVQRDLNPGGSDYLSFLTIRQIP